MDVNPYQSPAVPETTKPGTKSAAEEMPSRTSVLLLPMSIVIGSMLVGIMSCLIRPYIDNGGLHYDALASVVILIAACLALVIHNRHHFGLLGHLLYQMENVALWGGYAGSWTLVYGSIWDDLWITCIGCGLVTAVLGSILLAIIHWLAESAVGG